MNWAVMWLVCLKVKRADQFHGYNISLKLGQFNMPFRKRNSYYESGQNCELDT